MNYVIHVFYSVFVDRFNPYAIYPGGRMNVIQSTYAFSSFRFKNTKKKIHSAATAMSF